MSQHFLQDVKSHYKTKMRFLTASSTEVILGTGDRTADDISAEDRTACVRSYNFPGIIIFSYNVTCYNGQKCGFVAEF